MSKMSIVVGITKPQGMSRQDMVNYVRDAVHSHAGAFESSHPLFGRCRSATVRSLGKDADMPVCVDADEAEKPKANDFYDAYQGALERALIAEKELLVAEQRQRELQAQLDLHTNPPALHPIQVIGELVTCINAQGFVPPATGRHKEREFWKAGARSTLGEVNTAINQAAHLVMSQIAGPSDAQLFQYWIREAERNPSRVARKIGACLAADEYRQALIELMDEDAALQLEGKPVREEGSIVT